MARPRPVTPTPTIPHRARGGATGPKRGTPQQGRTRKQKRTPKPTPPPQQGRTRKQRRTPKPKPPQRGRTRKQRLNYWRLHSRGLDSGVYMRAKKGPGRARAAKEGRTNRATELQCHHGAPAAHERQRSGSCTSSNRATSGRCARTSSAARSLGSSQATMLSRKMGNGTRIRPPTRRCGCPTICALPPPHAQGPITFPHNTEPRWGDSSTDSVTCSGTTPPPFIPTLAPGGPRGIPGLPRRGPGISRDAHGCPGGAP